MRARLAVLVLTVAFTVYPVAARAKCCVWRVTSPDNKHTLYLAGSVHALRPADHPLPAAYDQALAASGEVVFETEPSVPADRLSRALERAATLPRGTTLRDHVDPRTYAYLQRVMARVQGSTDPEKKIEHLRAWVLGWRLESPSGMAEVRKNLGVDRTVEQAARRAGKDVSGLVGMEEHLAVFGGLSDADAEAYLLLCFIHLDTAGAAFARNVAAWRRGDADAVERSSRVEFQAAPAFYQRLVPDRNRRWLPKVEGYLRGGRTRMIVAGAAHMGGPDGLPALLQAAGYRVEQL